MGASPLFLAREARAEQGCSAAPSDRGCLRVVPAQGLYGIPKDASEPSHNLITWLAVRTCLQLTPWDQGSRLSLGEQLVPVPFSTADFQRPRSSSIFQPQPKLPLPFLMCCGFHSPPPLQPPFSSKHFPVASLEIQVFPFQIPLVSD